jgi:hypothetical protein
MKFQFNVTVSDVIAFALSNSTGSELDNLLNDLIAKNTAVSLSYCLMCIMVYGGILDQFVAQIMAPMEG